MTESELDLKRRQREGLLERVARLTARARVEGWYEDNTDWAEVDELLQQLGYMGSFDRDRVKR